MNKSDVLKNAPYVAKLLKTLGNESTLKVLCFLSESSLSVSAICEYSGISQSHVSQILKKLELNSLVTSEREGKWVNYSIASHELLELMKCLHQLYCKS